MSTHNPIERLSTGIPEVDHMIAGGIPRGFLVACTGEPGTGKTIFSIHFIGPVSYTHLTLPTKA